MSNLEKLYEATEEFISDRDRLDIAHEVYIGEKFTTLTYQENWKKKDKIEELDLRSKKSFEHWLMGKNENSPDLAELYIKNHGDHFNEENRWKARYLLPAVRYIGRKLLDPEIIENEEIRKEFKMSAREDFWLENVLAYTANYLTRKLKKMEALKSSYLTQKIEALENMRLTLKKVHKAGNTDDKEIQSEIDEEKIASKLLEEMTTISTTIRDNNKDELRYYQQVKDEINNYLKRETLFIISDNLSLGMKKTLPS